MVTDHPDIIGFEDEYLKVFDRVKLVKKLLPMYYTHCKFSSFSRQLNDYGFVRVGDNRYYHACFDPSGAQLENIKRRNESELLQKVKRLEAENKDLADRLAFYENLSF